jgi:hypothetical protein
MQIQIRCVTIHPYLPCSDHCALHNGETDMKTAESSASDMDIHFLSKFEGLYGHFLPKRDFPLP